MCPSRKVMLSAAVFVALLVFIISLQRLSVSVSSLLSIVSFILLILLFTVYAAYTKERVRQKIEKILPEFLTLVAANIKAGMTPVVALRNSIRPEFSPLSEEVSYATNKSLGTESFVEALFRIPSRFDSETLQRVFALFVTGQLSGGDLPGMLEGLAEDIREIEQVRQRVSLGVDMYVTFLAFSMILGMPLLFGVSYTFLSVIQSINTEVGIDTAFLLWIFVSYLVVTSIITGGFIGLVKKGRIVGGVVQGIILALSSTASFFIITTLLSLFVAP